MPEGEHTIKVVAIDNLDKSAVSQSSIRVTQSSSGGCKNIPNYSSSANYTAGDQSLITTINTRVILALGVVQVPMGIRARSWITLARRMDR